MGARREDLTTEEPVMDNREDYLKQTLSLWLFVVSLRKGPRAGLDFSGIFRGGSAARKVEKRGGWGNFVLIRLY